MAVQDVRRFERYLTHPPIDINAMAAKVEDVMSAADLDEPVHADLAGRLEQIEKHRITIVSILPTAYRTNLSGVIIAPVTFMWNVEKR